MIMMREWEKERRIILKNLKEFMEKWRTIGEAIAWGTIYCLRMFPKQKKRRRKRRKKIS